MVKYDPNKIAQNQKKNTPQQQPSAARQILKEISQVKLNIPRVHFDGKGVIEKFRTFWKGLTKKQQILLIIVWLTALVVAYRCFLPFRAEWYYREGYNLEASGQLEQATNSMQEAVCLAPIETFYAVTLGKEYEDLSRKAIDKEKKLFWLNKANETYSRIIKISPRNPWYHNRLGELYRLYAEIYDDPKVKEQYLASSDAKIIYAASLDKNNGLFQMSLAYLYHRKGQFDKAMELYQKVLDIDPKMSEAYFNMADIWRQRGNINKSIEMYQSIVSTNPTFANAHLSLGRIYYSQGNLKKAEEEFVEEIKLNKRNITAYQSLGALLMQKKDWEMAARVYARILQVDPQQVGMRQYLAQCYYSMGMIDEAIAELNLVLAADPNNAQIQGNIRMLEDIKNRPKKKAAVPNAETTVPAAAPAAPAPAAQ